MTKRWTNCACKPGRELDGWQELRSKNCLDEELQVWHDMFSKMPEIIKRLKT